MMRGYQTKGPAVPASYSDELGFARELAELGGRLALGHFRRDPESKRKADGTWVTEADWAVEAQIRLRIARTFPEHNVLGEEEGLTAAGGGPPSPNAPTWVIDPIDGTNNYIAGIPVWATLVGLQVEGASVLGVANAPALNELYDAAVGQGARMNGDVVHVDPVDDLARATVLYASYSSFQEAGLGEAFDALARASWRTRGFGDFWGHMLVARGAAHIMVETDVALWDVAALEPIVTEAGGRISRLDGTPWREAGSCLTTCGSLHDEVLGLVAAAAPGHREP